MFTLEAAVAVVITTLALVEAGVVVMAAQATPVAETLLVLTILVVVGEVLEDTKQRFLQVLAALA